MISITIVGAGVHGTRLAEKYKKFPAAKVRAVVSRHEPTAETWKGIPFFTSAKLWKKEFGTPNKNDVFDINVHHDILLSIVKEFVAIGAKNFVLPKPVALTSAELTTLKLLVKRHKLHIVVGSQWHYSAFLPQIANFLKKHKKNIASVEIVFSRLFEGDRASTYTPTNAFLPHILQILADLTLVTSSSVPLTESLTDTHARLHYTGAVPVRVVSDLREPIRQEYLKVFLKGKKAPALVADFARVAQSDGSVVYPSITIDGKKKDIKEDVLESMVGSALGYFAKPKAASNILTFAVYEPVAKQLVRIAEFGNKTVAVVGGGIFGILSALETAKKGYPVVIFEKEEDVLLGASLANQCRVHMGYHYPRDDDTARHSRLAGKDFSKLFAPAIKKINNYYMVAKDGSLTSPAEFKAFCKRLALPHPVAWPKGVNINRDKIAVSHQVPEKMFDAHKLREILKRMLAASDNVALVTSAEVSALEKKDGMFNLQYSSKGVVTTARFAAVVNATYGGANYINQMMGLPLADYQYETVELLVMKTPWKGTGWAIVDGPFLGAVPFGFSDTHLLYDVHISVLERVIGPLPDMKFSHVYHNSPKRLKARLEEYYTKWQPFLPDIRTYPYVSSLYITRMVLPKVEKTDARPTLLHEVAPGMWQIFSGKITTSVPQAKELAQEIDTYLRK